MISTRSMLIKFIAVFLLLILTITSGYNIFQLLNAAYYIGSSGSLIEVSDRSLAFFGRIVMWLAIGCYSLQAAAGMLPYSADDEENQKAQKSWKKRKSVEPTNIKIFRIVLVNIRF